MNVNISKKEILFSIIIILLLLIIFFSAKYLNSKTIFPINDKQKLDNINFKDILDSKNISDCKYLTNPSKSKICEVKLSTCSNDTCFYEKAIVNRVEKDCFKIKNTSLKIKCTSIIKYNSLIQNPVLKNDVNLCDKFTQKINIEKCRDNFYYAKAINSKNKSFCLNIKNEVFQNECQSN